MSKWQVLAAAMVIVIVGGVAYGLGTSSNEPAQASETTEAPAIASPTVDPDVKEFEESYNRPADIPFTGGYGEDADDQEPSEASESLATQAAIAMGPRAARLVQTGVDTFGYDTALAAFSQDFGPPVAGVTAQDLFDALLAL